ncbi:MAG: SgcJ/EcaC family oxidoreductase [Pseudomonadota bacterium]
MTTDEQALHDLLMDYATKASAGDLQAWLSLWCEDGVQLPVDAPARSGIANIRAGMAPAFAAFDLTVTIHSVESACVNGEVGMTHCNYSVRAVPKQGGESIDIMRDGKALTIYRKQPDGRWKIAYDCVNSNTPVDS